MAVRLLTLTAALLLAGCGTTATPQPRQTGPKVVATTWNVGVKVKAAPGVKDFANALEIKPKQ